MAKTAIPSAAARRAKPRNSVPIKIFMDDRETRTRAKSPADLDRTRRNAKIINLRLKGYTQTEIAEQVGMDPASVSNILTKYMASVQEDTTLDTVALRNINILRLERAIVGINDYLENPQTKTVTTPTGEVVDIELPPDVLAAANTLVKVIDRQAKLGNLDAPKEITVNNVRREYVGVNVEDV